MANHWLVEKSTGPNYLLIDQRRGKALAIELTALLTSGQVTISPLACGELRRLAADLEAFTDSAKHCQDDIAAQQGPVSR